MTDRSSGTVIAVSRSPVHGFSKPNDMFIRLRAGLGVEGDAHFGLKVQHLYHVRKNPDQPNLRQVHLIHEELIDELRDAGFAVAPGAMGENITTRGVDLLGLPRGAMLRFGAGAVVEVTGLRSPCHQLNKYQAGLMDAVLGADEQGKPIFKSGIMGIVLADGEIRPGDPIEVSLPPAPHQPLERV